MVLILWAIAVATGSVDIVEFVTGFTTVDRDAEVARAKVDDGIDDFLGWSGRLEKRSRCSGGLYVHSPPETSLLTLQASCSFAVGATLLGSF